MSDRNKWHEIISWYDKKNYLMDKNYFVYFGNRLYPQLFQVWKQKKLAWLIFYEKNQCCIFCLRFANSLWLIDFIFYYLGRIGFNVQSHSFQSTFFVVKFFVKHKFSGCRKSSTRSQTTLVNLPQYPSMPR